MRAQPTLQNSETKSFFPKNSLKLEILIDSSNQPSIEFAKHAKSISKILFKLRLVQPIQVQIQPRLLCHK